MSATGSHLPGEAMTRTGARNRRGARGGTCPASRTRFGGVNQRGCHNPRSGMKGYSMPSGKDITGGGGRRRREAERRWKHELGKHRRHQEECLLLVLPQELPGCRPPGGRARRRLHLRRLHRALPVDPRPGAAAAGRPQDALHRHPDPARDQGTARRLRDRPGARQEGPVGRRAQPLQAAGPRRGSRDRGRARQVEHPPDRPDRLRQDPAGPDPGPDPQRPLRHRRRHHARPRPATSARTSRTSCSSCSTPPTSTSRPPSAASSTSTRSTRSARPPTTSRSPATSRARGCSRPS